MKQRVSIVWAVAFLGVIAHGACAYAAADPLIEGGRLCTEQFPVQEQQNNIPTHLLAAISTTESGRWHEGLGMAIPWPWTINVDGKGYYFKTKAEAMAQTQNLMAQGKRSIDVGCMQVNLKHHAKAFANLDQAFDPKTNVAYAAKFLHDNYAELGDWIKATAAYHSRTQVYGQQYLTQIERSWNKIVAKVAAARANQRDITPVTARAPAAEATVAEANAAIAQAQKDMKTGRNSQPIASTLHPISSTHNVQIIKLGQGTSAGKASDVLVIRGPSALPLPTSPSAAVTTPGGSTAPLNQAAVISPTPTNASVTSMPTVTTPTTPTPRDDTMLVRTNTDSVRRVALDKAAPVAHSSEPTTPANFVFN